MKSLFRFCLACLLLLLTRSIAQAVTTEECQNGCSARQDAAAQACQSSCQSMCTICNGSIRSNYYLNFGCYADPTESYCITDGYCYCECAPGYQ